MASLEEAGYQFTLLDFEYAVYGKRNKRGRAFPRQWRRAGLAARVDAVNRSRGEPLPLVTEAYLSRLTVAVRGVVQQYAVDPESIDVRSIETFFSLLAGIAPSSS